MTTIPVVSVPAAETAPAPARSGAGRLVVIAMALGACLVAAWPVRVEWLLPGPVRGVPLTAHVAGMLAGYAVLALMVLMSRSPLLERDIGADRLARWHSWGGRLVLTLVLVHAVAAVWSWAQARDRSPLLALWDVLRFPGLVAATIGTLLMVLIGVLSVRAARRRLPYETWHSIHLTMYVAVAFSFAHQLAGPDLAGRVGLQIVWALMYTHAFGLVLRHRVLAPLRAAARHRLRVAEVVPETKDVVSIVVKGKDLQDLHALPGQFFRWRFLTPDTWVTAHPFSLSEAPTGDRLRLTVKNLGSGSRLLQSVDVGTWVVAEGPYGAMTAARRTRRDVLLIAAGVGITPMRALFETMPVSAGQDLMLLYRATTPEEVVFRDELDEIAARRHARVVYLLGSAPHLLSAEALTRLVPGLVDRDVFLCGPPRFSAAVHDYLHDAGLPDSRLHEERFAF